MANEIDELHESALRILGGASSGTGDSYLLARICAALERIADAQETIATEAIHSVVVSVDDDDGSARASDFHELRDEAQRLGACMPEVRASFKTGD